LATLLLTFSVLGANFLPSNVVHALDPSTMPVGQRYWSIIDNKGSGRSDERTLEAASSSTAAKMHANEALIDYAVGTINTQYYDNTGGAWFNPKDFYLQWKSLQHFAEDVQANSGDAEYYQLTAHAAASHHSNVNLPAIAIPKSLRNVPKEALQLHTRDGTVEALKWLVGSLQDPYSKYMTREELQNEYRGHHDGFLGTGAYVEAPSVNHRFIANYDRSTTATANTPSSQKNGISKTNKNSKNHPQRWLSSTRVANLPVVTAVSPNSPAERAGITVGDRIVAVGDRDFLGWTRPDIAKTLHSQYNAETYLGVADLTIAKPIYAVKQELQQETPMRPPGPGMVTEASFFPDTSSLPSVSSAVSPREVVLGYRATKLKLPTKATEPSFLAWSQSSAFVGSSSSSVVHAISSSTSHGDAVVQYEMLTSSSGSIFDHLHSSNSRDDFRIGYIRLTRFSKLATDGFQQAVQALEDAGAQSYIIDLRNNYGGIIQEAMLTASSLLRDPHAILCYTLNACGGFTPVDVEQYVVDPRYPGYLLSREPKTAVLQQVQRERPNMFRDKNGKVDWDPPSSYASIHEQVIKRGIRRISYVNDQMSLAQQQQQRDNAMLSIAGFNAKHELNQRKDVVILINEGTASSAEFFTAALHDNGRSLAVVGTKSFGKGLIQHTFPMPDGGGLKLTVGEFLRPSLQHVTNVFDARFDDETGEISGGGIRPDIYCDSKQGIPGNPKADLCVGIALDVLEERALTSELL
jgi:C-terminal processing protease CtpA/Prc